MRRQPTPEEVEDYCEKNIKPILNKHRATIVAADYSAHLKARPLESFDVMTIEYQGERIALDASMIGIPKDLEFFLSHFDRVKRIAEDLKPIEAVFHTDIFGKFKSEFSSTERISIAYHFVCQKLIEANRTIHSD